MNKSIKTTNNRFRKQGGSKYIAIRNILGAMEVNETDKYEIEYLPDQIIIRKEQ